MKIVGCILAAIGFACVVKYFMNCKEGRCLCGWHNIKVEDEKPADETVTHNIKVEDEKPADETVTHKIKVEDEKPTGSRYGSNPIHY